MKEKVLVIGLDGATFDIIIPLVDKGRLPCLTSLIKGGVVGNLRSTIPPSSLPAWPSFMTGKNPGKHGVYDFLKRTKDDYIGRLVSSRDLKTETLWDLASYAGKKCVVINVTGTHPPKKVNGCIISGMLTPKNANYVYPSKLKKELDKEGYIIFKDFPGNSSPDYLFQELVIMERKRTDVASYLMNKKDWDFFMIMMIGTDMIQHKLWSEREIIFDYYCEIDKMISELIHKAGENVNVIVLSDHGFGPLKKYFHVNVWLHKLGLLNYKIVNSFQTRKEKIKTLRGDKSSSIGDRLYRLGLTKEKIEYLLKILRIYNLLKKYMPYEIKILFSPPKKINFAINWSKTKAALSSFFGTETQSLMINLKNREPEGIVNRSEYSGIKDYLIKELIKLKDPKTGDKIVQKVFSREELYHGPFLEDAPDMVMLLKGSYKPSNKLGGKKIISSTNENAGSHRLKGIFIAKGPDITKNKQIRNIQIIDVAPTILRLLDIEPPKDMDGRVLEEILIN